jgi:GTP:adenosylcobinamide-phosphate guanylyltransferase
MAANRRPSANLLAEAFGTSHKCAVPVVDVPMIERVIGTVRSWACARRILISAETPDVLRGIPSVNNLLAAGDVVFAQSGATLAQSVANAASVLADKDYPLVVTTGDNVLHTVDIMHAFYAASMASAADVTFALTSRAIVAEAYPVEAPGIGYLRFAEGEHSNCNVYMIRNSSAVHAANVMRHGGQFRSHPLRILRTVGLRALLQYKLGRLTFVKLCVRLERIFGVSVGIIVLPYADAPIDADTLESLALIERILQNRGETRHVG